MIFAQFLVIYSNLLVICVCGYITANYSTRNVKTGVGTNGIRKYCHKIG